MTPLITIVVSIIANIFMIFVHGRATIGVASMKNSIPKNKLGWIKSMFIYLGYILMLLFGLSFLFVLFSALFSDDLKPIAISFLMLFGLVCLCWLAIRGSKKEVKEVISSSGYSVGWLTFFLGIGHYLMSGIIGATIGFIIGFFF